MIIRAGLHLRTIAGTSGDLGLSMTSWPIFDRTSITKFTEVLLIVDNENQGHGLIKSSAGL